MTSRDIQITLKKSREHTSRLMKKLFEEGLVQRNTETKPYTYSITEKGIASRLEKLKQTQLLSKRCFSSFSKVILCDFTQKKNTSFYY